MKQEYKTMYMEMAEACARASKAIRRKVGCVLVNDKGIISEGLNGMPPKWETEECEYKQYLEGIPANTNTYNWIKVDFPFEDDRGYYRLITKPECRHAEVAALEKLWGKPESAEGATCFVTTAPCKNCAIKLFTAGIKKVYYKDTYSSEAGIEYLINKGVKVEKYES